MSKNADIYLDYNATTPVDPRVLESMLSYFSDKFGNSVNSSYSFGLEASQAIEKARRSIADFIHCSPEEIFFTSGATEANNWAIEGLIETIESKSFSTESIINNQKNTTARPHFIISPLEHNSVIKAASRAARFFDVEIEMAEINSYGQVDLEKLKKQIRPNTKLIAAMWVQNEIGSINPISEIAQICKENNIYFLSDATQAIGKVPVKLDEVKVDLLSFSAHKLGGPKGTGFLYIRKELLPSFSPLICGGGHESGKRSGTLNTPGIVGLGKAIEIAAEESQHEINRQMELRNFLWQELKSAFPTARMNGHPTERSPNNLHVTFANCRVPDCLKGLAVSRGSACHSGKSLKSHVLQALKFSDLEAAQSLRLTVGKATTFKEIEQAIEIFKSNITELSQKQPTGSNSSVQL